MRGGARFFCEKSRAAGNFRKKIRGRFAASVSAWFGEGRFLDESIATEVPL